MKLETVATEKVNIDYSLVFYMSKSPLEFNHFVGEVFLNFLSYPGNIEMAHEQKRLKLKEVEQKINNNPNGFMLPHAHVELDCLKFDKF